jgi:hypothetical protein
MTRLAGASLVFLSLLAIHSSAQAPANTSFVGTVAAFKSGTEIEFKPDTGVPVDVKVTPDTLAQKIAPGETSLKNAVGASIADLMIGDRVLVTLESGTNNARRVVIMSATDIGKRDEADRQDWNTRGLSGVVAGRSGDTITIRSQSLQGETRQTVTVSDQTKFRRYAADSVRFADAKPSRAGEISVGDQLRARGQKSADGNSVAAEEVVFGTFLVTAGSVVSANPDTKEITLKETGSGKPVVVQLTADSRIKQMAVPGAPGGAFPGGGFPGGAFPGGAFPGGGPGAGAPGRGAPPPGSNGGMPPGRGEMPPGLPQGRGGAPTIAQMVDAMKPGAFDDIKPGETVVVSSTKGAQSDHLTAIMLLTNADMLIRMASMGAGGGGQPNGAGRGQGMQPGGMSGGGMDIGGMLGGFGMSGIGP